MMGVIYQLTFFLALGLLAVVITVFVFAVSLLGRAMEAAAKSEREKLVERKENNAKEMAALKQEIEKAEANGQIPKGLTRTLEKLEKRDKKFEKELSKIRKAPELLTVKGGVLPSGASLLGALILAGAAWYLSNIQISIIPVLIWIAGLAAIGYGIYRIYCSLKVVESVAITSEEAALKRTIEAFKIAQKELEEESKPKLELMFIDEHPPFNVKAGEETTIKFGLALVQGLLAKKPKVYFFAPPGFGFPGISTWVQSESVTTVGGYITTEVELPDVRKGIYQAQSIIVKAPSDKGGFSLWYRTTCEGLPSDLLEFQVVVE